jgi:trk system potassium uptake protein TrkH
MQLSPVLNILGLLATILAAAMLIPMGVDLYAGSGDWQVFALSALLTAFVGVSVWLATNQRDALDLGLRQAFLLTNGSWVMIGIFGALPFMFSELDLSFTDSVFESVSGITTTGSTILVEIEQASPGILIWRALLQWLGGVGIVVMAMAVLPMLSVGGMQLFRTESYERAENVVPRATQLAGGIGLVYTGLTALWAVMLGLAGMDTFDAVAHSMTTLATGGYSTRTASIGAFDSVAVEWIIITGMIVGSLPFAHYLAMVRGGWRSLLNDPQVRWFLILVVGLVLLLIWHLMQTGLGFGEAARQASFNGVSIMTGTGYVSANFSALGGFATTILLIVMFIVG